METARLHLLLAVLARRAGLNTGNLDIVASWRAACALRDPGADLAVAAALVSAVRDAAPAAGHRVHRRGGAFRRDPAGARVPRGALPNSAGSGSAGASCRLASRAAGIELVPVRTIRDALEALR